MPQVIKPLGHADRREPELRSGGNILHIRRTQNSDGGRRFGELGLADLYAAPELRHAGKFVELIMLVFERPPEPLEKDVVEGTAASIQADARADFFQE